MKSAFVKSVAAAIAGGVFAFAATAGDVPSIGEFSSTEVGDNYVTFSATVSDFGDGETGATASFAYGITADALDRTQQVATVTSTESFSLTLTRLQPNSIYYVALVIKNSSGVSATSDTIALHTAKPDAVSASQIGLYQTFFTTAHNKWTKDYTTLPEGTDWTHYTDDDRIYRRELGTIMAYVGGNGKSGEYTSEVWGDAVYWPMNGGQWAYWGYIRMEKDKSYKFRAYIDDAERVAVTNIATGAEVVLINDSAWATSETSSVFVPEVTGWYPLEVRMSDGSGGLGGRDTSNDYKNTVNMGYSSDGGATWNLLLDPGDGSLLRTEAGAGVDIDVSESASGGSLSLALSFASSESARTLVVVWGPTHGGNDSTNGWAFAAVAGNVAAGETSATLAPPDGWGSDDCLVLRYCFVDGDGGVFGWSPSTYWRDLSEPSVSDLALDGPGGDTLKVTGYASAPGGACSLQVYVGTSADAMSPWPGASRTMSASGRFSFTLFTDDASSGLMLKPGETYYVAVSVKAASGVTSRSHVASAKTSAAADFGETPSCSVSRRTVSVSGTFSDLGMGSSPSLTLWVGANEASLAQVDAKVTLSGSSYSASHALPEFEKTYVVQVRAASESAGGTASLEAKSAAVSVTTKDTTTYTWKGGSSGAWSDKDNWDDGHDGDSLGYPRVAAATATFPAGAVAVVSVDGSYTVGTLECGALDADVTLVRAASLSSAPTLTCSTFEPGMTSGRTVLDGVAVKMGSSSMSFGGGRTLALTNATSLAVGNNLNCYNNAAGGTLVVAGGSTLTANYGNIGPCAVVIDDASVQIAGGICLYAPNGAETTFRFLGAAPLLQFTGTSEGGDNWFGINYAGDSALSVTMEFSVPVGGYATPPVQRLTSTGSRYFGRFVNADKAGGTMSAVVRSDSPGAAAKEEFSTTLISWPGVGISQDFVTEVLLPKARNSFSWEDPTSSGRPASLSVTLGGRKGLVLKVL